MRINYTRFFFFNKHLPSHTTSAELFTIVNKFMVDIGINWNKCVYVSSEGARSMCGRNSGVITMIKTVAPLVAVSYTHLDVYKRQDKH